jgi:hypothetical protein
MILLGERVKASDVEQQLIDIDTEAQIHNTITVFFNFSITNIPFKNWIEKPSLSNCEPQETEKEISHRSLTEVTPRTY